MLFPQLEEKLQASKQALNTATSENIIEQCKQHLSLLAEYRISGVRFHGGDNRDLMTIQEAVDLASLLRRKDYVAQTTPDLPNRLRPASASTSTRLKYVTPETILDSTDGQNGSLARQF
jgi:hypothetical protein